MRYNSALISICFLLILTNSIQAQTDLPSENIEVVKDFDARLGESNKIKLFPELFAVDTGQIKYEYNVSARELKVEYEAPSLRPLAMPMEQPHQGFRNYARAGYGKPNAILGDVGISYLNDGLYEISLNGHYQSANNKSFEDQKFSELIADLSGNYYFSDYFATSGNLQYARDEYFMYGYDHEVTVGPELKNGSRQFNTIGFSAKVYNPERTPGGFDYQGEIELVRKKDQLELSENQMRVQAKGTKWIENKYPLSFLVKGELTKLTGVDNFQEEATLNNFFIKPSFIYNKSKLRFKIAAELATSKDEIFYFPDLEISYKLLDNKLIPYAGWNGTMQQNNYYALTEYNPFVITSPALLNNHSWHQYFAGVKGSFKGIIYDGKVGYKTFKNLALYEQNIVDERRFDVLFDDGNTFLLSGSVSSQIHKNLKAGATVYKNFYNLDSYERAWHLPGLELQVYAQYQGLENRLFVRPELNVMDGVPIRNIDNELDRLGSLLDVSIEAEYFILKHVGVFVQVNNLTSNKRERWQQYPTYGLNAIAGVTARF